MRLLMVYGLFFLIHTTSYSQDSTLLYRASISLGAMSYQTPFWLHANQFGHIPVRGPYIAGQIGAFRKYKKIQTHAFDWSAGLDLASFTGESSSIFLSEAYISGKNSYLELSLGLQKNLVGLIDTTLSIGSLSISGNSRTYPKIQIATPGYIPLRFTDNFIGVLGSYSDGWLGSGSIQFGNVNRVPNIYLHHKSLYLRLGKPHHSLRLYGGFNHQAMWGGEEKIFTGGLNATTAYGYVVIGKSWAMSRVGNHFGTVDCGAELIGSKHEYYIYRQNIYEDGSLISLTNIADGLTGFRIKRTKRKGSSTVSISTFLFEYLNTMQQGGSIFDLDNKIFGRDNYYNHYLYKQGWSYKGRILGTPVIPTQDLQNENLKKDESSITTNNRLRAFNIGITGKLYDIMILSKVTYTLNFGTYGYPIVPKRQFNFLIKAEKTLSSTRNSYLSIRVANDSGLIYPQSFGIELGWRKHGLFM